LAATAVSCGGSATSTQPNPIGATSAALVPLADCAAVEKAVRVGALVKMHEALDEQLEQLLQREQWCHGPVDGGVMADAAAGPPTGAAGAAGKSGYQPGTAGTGGAGGAGGSGTSTQGSGDGASQVSGTNNQIVGVDEADFLKNDNKYIYVVSNGRFRIVEAWPAASTHKLAEVAIEGTPTQMFVAGNRALVYSSLAGNAGPQAPAYGGYQPGACTYGYDCEFTGDGRPLKITVLDISDKSAPAVVRELRFSGSLVSARRIGAAVHTVVSDPGAVFPRLEYYPSGLAFCSKDSDPAGIRAAVESLRAKNIGIIMTTPLTDLVPTITDTVHADGAPQPSTNVLAQCPGFYGAPSNDGSTFTSVVSLDIGQPTPPSSSTIVSRPGAVFASSSSLYVSVPARRSDHAGWFDEMREAKQASTVHKFRLGSEPPAVSYVASGLVKGKVLNQFSMDEHAETFRIATTTGALPSSSVHNTVSVLEQRRDALVKVGVLDDIARGEDIRSVRFSGERAFVVTFKKTDPLFVIDLADPTRPAIMGELKIPGFSTYMHMMDANHLLTIGYDASDQGSFAWFTGVMLQIFDVTVMTDPKLVHKHVIGTRGTSSEALTNHLAFNYFAPKNLLAVPMTICEGGTGSGQYGSTMTFSGLLVYDVTVQNGFSERGRVSHPTQGSGYDSTGCHNWWTHAASDVKRSVLMDDFVYSISDRRLKVNHLDDLSADIVELSL
jgi:hypothetical protein